MKGDLFTIESFATLAGASFIVYIITGVIQDVFKFNPKWFGLVLSFVVAFLGAILAQESTQHYIVAFFNGFLIYANVVGIVAVTGKDLPKTPDDPDGPYGSSDDSLSVKRSFRTKWY